jgi:hydrogenase maturation factor
MGRKYRNGINVMHSTRLEALSLMDNHKGQCGSYLFCHVGVCMSEL